MSGSKPFDHAIAGTSAAIVSTLCLHPLDLVKTRLQVDSSSKKHVQGRIVTMFRGIFTNEGGLRGLYRGLTPNLAGNAGSWGLYFWWYTLIKSQMSQAINQPRLSPQHHLLAAASAGALTQLFTNPLWVVKTRMCISSRSQAGAYSGLFDGLAKIYQQEGIRGLYRGLVPGLFGVSHGALQFMAYEELKKLKPTDETSTLDYIIMASSSKVFAAVSTYPYQVVRSRLQNRGQYSGVIDVIRKTFVHEGFLGFYKGLVPNVLRVLPGTCITFVVYEHISRILS